MRLVDFWVVFGFWVVFSAGLLLLFWGIAAAGSVIFSLLDHIPS